MMLRHSATRMLATAVAMVFLLAAGATPAWADDDDDDRDDGGICSTTASLQRDACRYEVKDDFYGAQAICLQVPERRERRTCFREAYAARREGRELCGDQFRARRDLCDLLGEGRYAPDFDPDNFDDDYTDLTSPNPYFPLTIGNVWEFQASDESNRIEVLDKTKLIEGVTCIVLNDLVFGEDISEDTDDWFGQRKDGTVDYCGESVMDQELFEGDVPLEFELVAIDGSFKAGRDGDLSGTIMLGVPVVGVTYRQEWSAGNAEDAATVVSTTYDYGADSDLDEFAIRELVELLCDGDCVVTREVTPIEPDVLDYKYYAPGIGIFLKVNPGTEEVNQLVDCNFDPRCDDLPQP